MGNLRINSQTTDAELVAACADGNERAWHELVSRYRRLIYTIPYRMGLDPADADEVFQITFTRLAERIDRLEQPDRVRAWLVTTAKRVSLNAIARRRSFENPDDTLANVADPADLPSEEVRRMEEQQLLRLALRRLGGRCEKLLRLLYYPEGMAEPSTYDEVSESLGMPVGSIGPTRMRCLKKLRTLFEELTEDEE